MYVWNNINVMIPFNMAKNYKIQKIFAEHLPYSIGFGKLQLQPLPSMSLQSSDTSQ